jgi:hypothetical protein
MGGARPSGVLCSEECKEKDSEARYQATMTEILKDCCKVCGIYACKNHDDWVVCEGCPSQTKYWLKYNWRCPACGKIPPGVEPGPREWSPRGLQGIR